MRVIYQLIDRKHIAMATIKEDYVSYDTARLLKEKGFIIPYDSFRGVYINGKFKRLSPGSPYLYNMDDEVIDVCSIQMAMKWLREEYNIDIIITIGGFIEKGKVYFCSVYKNLINYGDLKECSTYEEACEAGIKHCLNNII